MGNGARTALLDHAAQWGLRHAVGEYGWADGDDGDDGAVGDAAGAREVALGAPPWARCTNGVEWGWGWVQCRRGRRCSTTGGTSWPGTARGTVGGSGAMSGTLLLQHACTRIHITSTCMHMNTHACT
jgi:hypothetical protein